MKIKKILSLLLAAAMVLSLLALTSCGSASTEVKVIDIPLTDIPEKRALFGDDILPHADAD